MSYAGNDIDLPAMTFMPYIFSHQYEMVCGDCITPLVGLGKGKKYLEIIETFVPEEIPTNHF